MSRQMRLNAFLHPTGHHVAAWRHPDAQADAGANFEHYKRIARTAERGKFDAVFVADFAGSISSHELDAASRMAFDLSFEPLTLIAALAAVTERIGLIATVTTTFNEPFNLARKFASIDLISGGRSGWNLVTSVNASEAFNFGLDQHVLHADRYERAREFLQVVFGLWDSWEDTSFPRDKESGLFFDPATLHILNHKGKHFSVRGPLNVPRSPQGRPVLVQAGSSEPGRDLAGESAEVVFTAHQTLESAQEFYADVKSRAEAYGRDPDHVKILPGVFPVVGATRQEAENKYEQIQVLTHPVVGLDLLSGLVGGDVRKYPIDGPLPDLPETNGNKSRQRLLFEMARRENLSIRDLYLRVAGARGHWTIVGTPAYVADRLEEWFVGHGADGFNVMPPILPTGLDDFVDQVIPELQRRGLFRREYEGKTLRENLGLPKPSHRFAKPAAEIPHAIPETQYAK